MLPPPLGEALGRLLGGLGDHPERPLARDAQHRLGLGEHEPAELGDPGGGALLDPPMRGGDLRVGGRVAEEEAPHERVLLDKAVEGIDARAEHRVRGIAGDALDRAFDERLAVAVEQLDVEVAL
jgi:hypothetical protein